MGNLITVKDDFEKAARRARLAATIGGIHRGIGIPDVDTIMHLETDSGIATTLLYSRDAMMHASGWFKNPDYERCWHLSMSWNHVSVLMRQTTPLDVDHTRAEQFARLVFGDSLRYAWIESAKSKAARGRVIHYRVFADEHWQPIMPRGEVYSREFTEAGWQSWSELHPDQPNAPHLQHENPDA